MGRQTCDYDKGVAFSYNEAAVRRSSIVVPYIVYAVKYAIQTRLDRYDTGVDEPASVFSFQCRACSSSVVSSVLCCMWSVDSACVKPLVCRMVRLPI